MTGRQITLKGYRLDKSGKLVKDQRRLDASARARQRGSKKVTVVRPTRANLARLGGPRE